MKSIFLPIATSRLNTSLPLSIPHDKLFPSRDFELAVAIFDFRETENKENNPAGEGGGGGGGSSLLFHKCLNQTTVLPINAMNLTSFARLHSHTLQAS